MPAPSDFKSSILLSPSPTYIAWNDQQLQISKILTICGFNINISVKVPDFGFSLLNKNFLKSFCCCSIKIKIPREKQRNSCVFNIIKSQAFNFPKWEEAWREIYLVRFVAKKTKWFLYTFMLLSMLAIVSTFILNWDS